LEHPWRLDELDVSVVDNLNVVAPGIQEIEGAASLDVNVGVPKRRADPLLVIDDEAEVPASVLGLRSARRKSDELIPMSMKAIDVPTLPRSSNSKKRPYQASASSTSPTSSAT